MLALNAELSLIFSTPLSMRVIPDAVALNTGLEHAIRARLGSGTGTRISNIGGWQSNADILNWPEPEIKRLAIELDRSIQQIWALPVFLKQRSAESQKRVVYSATGWANVNSAGDYNMCHVHPGHHLSAVYYVATGPGASDSTTEGRLELRDPRPAANYCFNPGPLSSGSLLITPQPGLLVVFPAWLEHLVHPFRGQGQRISIAVNIRFQDHKA